MIGGCGKQVESTAPQNNARQEAPISVESVATNTAGFSAGNLLSTRKVYVFFDPQCPHCGELWRASKPLFSTVHFIWIPVALLTPDRSAEQGAALLGSKDAISTMDAHEALLESRKGGLDVASGAIPESAMRQVGVNTEFFRRLNLTSVPFVVFQGKSGETKVFEGSLTTQALESELGL